MTFFEGSARVPPMISAPNIKPRHEATPVSTIDVCPTLCDLAGVSMESIKPWTQGESLIAISSDAVRTNPVAMECGRSVVCPLCRYAAANLNIIGAS